ncbi:hypothetical protein [Polycladidibacter hongkongensis]|uniref:hypothetical protein n=1 Tax=Polycladidibacter hongkongensis TaxID=1647556 RepID=UPI000A9AE5C9|nr:hypothetical protein [Pseudovibrio hongkongensis]
MATEQAKSASKPSKPNLDALYAPVGIRAVEAANRFCNKGQQAANAAVIYYPHPTD